MNISKFKEQINVLTRSNPSSDSSLNSVDKLLKEYWGKWTELANGNLLTPHQCQYEGNGGNMTWIPSRSSHLEHQASYISTKFGLIQISQGTKAGFAEARRKCNQQPKYPPKGIVKGMAIQKMESTAVWYLASPRSNSGERYLHAYTSKRQTINAKNTNQP